MFDKEMVKRACLWSMYTNLSSCKMLSAGVNLPVLMFVRFLDASGSSRKMWEVDSDEASSSVWCSAPAWPQETPAKGKDDTRLVSWKWADGVVAWAWQYALWNGRPLIMFSSDDAGWEERKG